MEKRKRAKAAPRKRPAGFDLAYEQWQAAKASLEAKFRQRRPDDSAVSRCFDEYRSALWALIACPATSLLHARLRAHVLLSEIVEMVECGRPTDDRLLMLASAVYADLGRIGVAK